MFIQEIEYPEVLSIRKEVLYPVAENADLAKLDDDDMGIHIGVIDKGETVGVVSIFLKDRKLQFRKLAIKKEFQKKGYGSAVLKWIADYAQEMQFDCIWANARKDALDFYLRNGYTDTNEEFEKNGIQYTIIAKNILKNAETEQE